MSTLARRRKSAPDDSADEVSANGAPGDGWLEPPQPQDLVITLLGSYVRGRHQTVWSGGIVRLLAELGFSTGASRVALARLARRDLISRVKEGRHVSYRLTDRTERLMAEGDRRIFAYSNHGASTQQITTLWHTLPEQHRLERGRLARRLRFLGFGSVQDGTWIALGNREKDVVALVRDLGVQEHCSVVVGRPSSTLGLAPLVERAWDLNAVEERYQWFIQRFGPFVAASEREHLADAEAFRIRTQCVHIYRAFPGLDPVLPETLAPRSSRTEAAKVFHKVYDGLEGASLRHFDAVTQARQIP